MGFIGVQPASVPLTASDITNDIINADKIADDSISEEHIDNTAITGFSALTSLADTDKFLVSDASDSNNLKYVENQYLGGGGAWTFLGSITASGASNSTFQNGSNSIVFDSTYSTYLITLNGMTCSSDDDTFRISFSHDSGSNYNSNATSISSKATINSSASTSHDGSPFGSFSSGACSLFGAQSNGSAEGFNGMVELHGMHITNRIKAYTYRFQMHQHNNLRGSIIGAGTVERNEDIDGVRFNCNSGTHSGTLRLYGLKAS